MSSEIIVYQAKVITMLFLQVNYVGNSDSFRMFYFSSLYLQTTNFKFLNVL